METVDRINEKITKINQRNDEQEKIWGRNYIVLKKPMSVRNNLFFVINEGEKSYEA